MLETTPNDDLHLVSHRTLEGRSHGACVQVDAVETHLRTAEARAHGHTRAQVAAMLCASRQAAQERYRELAERL